jgi:hypothetical protein
LAKGKPAVEMAESSRHVIRNEEEKKNKNTRSKRQNFCCSIVQKSILYIFSAVVIIFQTSFPFPSVPSIAAAAAIVNFYDSVRENGKQEYYANYSSNGHLLSKHFPVQCKFRSQSIE